MNKICSLKRTYDSDLTPVIFSPFSNMTMISRTLTDSLHLLNDTDTQNMTNTDRLRPTPTLTPTPDDSDCALPDSGWLRTIPDNAV